MDNVHDDVVKFRSAYAKKHPLICTSILFPYISDTSLLQEFVQALSTSLQEGIYSSGPLSEGLAGAIDLYEACLSSSNREIALLRAISTRCQTTPDSVADAGVQSHHRDVKDEEALKRGSSLIETPSGTSTLKDSVSKFFDTAKVAS